MKPYCNLPEHFAILSATYILTSEMAGKIRYFVQSKGSWFLFSHLTSNSLAVQAVCESLTVSTHWNHHSKEKERLITYCNWSSLQYVVPMGIPCLTLLPLCSDPFLEWFMVEKELARRLVHASPYGLGLENKEVQDTGTDQWTLLLKNLHIFDTWSACAPTVKIHRNHSSWRTPVDNR